MVGGLEERGGELGWQGDEAPGGKGCQGHVGVSPG